MLMGQWGFGAKGDLSGTVCLFSGPPGERLNAAMTPRAIAWLVPLLAVAAGGWCTSPGSSRGVWDKSVGTGKTLAAEAIGFETGKPLKVRA